MTMQEMTNLVTLSGGVENAALTMAFGIIADRLKRLSKEDRSDLDLLVKDLMEATDAEERESIVTAMFEILNQAPVRVQKMELPTGPIASGLQSWMDFVSARIRELRKHAGLTQEQLAEKAGLPQAHISRLESATHSPSKVTLEKIANTLEVPLSKFDPSNDE